MKQHLIPHFIVFSLAAIFVSPFFDGLTRVADYLFKSCLVSGLVFISMNKGFYRSKIFLYSFLFLFYNFVTVFFTEDLQLRLVIKHTAYSLYLLCFIYILGSIYPSFKNSEDKLRYILIIPVVCELISIIYFFSEGEAVRLVNYFKSVHPIHDATLFSIPAVYIVYQFKLKNSYLTNWILASCLLILEYGIMLSGSRSVILTLILVNVLFCFIVRDKRILMPIVILLFSFVSYKLTGLFLNDDSQIVDFEKIQQLVNRRDSGRLTLWKHIISDMSMQDFVFGKGFLHDHSYAQKMGRAFVHPHSAFVHTLFHGGIILLSFHLLILFEVLKIAYKHYRLTGSFYLLMFLLLSLPPQMFSGISIYGVDDRFNELVIIFWILVGISIHLEKRYRSSV